MPTPTRQWSFNISLSFKSAWWEAFRFSTSQAKWTAITDQVVDVIRGLLTEGRTLSDIAIYGESAGGGLAAGAVLKMRDKGLGMPAAVVLWSPWSDITETGDSYSTLKDANLVHHIS